MTRIRLLGSPGNLKGFEVSGHAGAGTEGNDLVCAAISALLASGQANQAAGTILAVFRQGAQDLAEAYPKHVQLIDETI